MQERTLRLDWHGRLCKGSARSQFCCQASCNGRLCHLLTPTPPCKMRAPPPLHPPPDYKPSPTSCPSPNERRPYAHIHAPVKHILKLGMDLVVRGTWAARSSQELPPPILDRGTGRPGVHSRLQSRTRRKRLGWRCELRGAPPHRHWCRSEAPGPSPRRQPGTSPFPGLREFLPPTARV